MIIEESKVRSKLIDFNRERSREDITLEEMNAVDKRAREYIFIHSETREEVEQLRTYYQALRKY